MADTTQLVRMPNGDVVAFPADMPKEEIGALILHKFPKEVAAAGTSLPGNGGTSNPNDPFFQGLALPDRPDPAHTAQPGEESTGFLAPVSHNRRTGEWAPAVPGVLTGIRDSLVNAAQLPGDVLAGKYPEMNPAVSKDQLSPELVGRGLNAATAVGADAVPVAALKLSQQGAALRAPGADAAAGFGIPLTKGQTSGDLQQITKEEMLRNGGGSAQNVVRNFDASQQGAIADAAGKIGASVGTHGESMPDLVTGAIQDKVAFHKDQASSLYQIAADGGVSVKPEMVAALPQVVAHSLETSAVHIDPQLTPSANAAMNILNEDTAKMTGELADAAAKPGAIAGSGGITLQGIEQIRKKLVGLGGGINDTDSRAMGAVKRAFDDWAQTAVDNMLVTGDPVALDALKQARAASSDYLSITEPGAGDQAAKSVAKMAKGDATSEEVANWLYGANVVSPTLNAPKVAQIVKDTVGADSPAFQAVRADVWTRLTQDMASGDSKSATKMAKSIETFLNDKGTTLSNVLYTREERAKMQDFADALKATITPGDAANPSRSGYTLMQMASGITRLLAGIATGGLTGNPAIGIATSMSIPVFKNIGARKAALKAIDQTPAAPAALNVGVPTNALKAGVSGTMGNDMRSLPPRMLAGAGTNRLVA